MPRGKAEFSTMKEITTEGGEHKVPKDLSPDIPQLKNMVPNRKVATLDDLDPVTKINKGFGEPIVEKGHRSAISTARRLLAPQKLDDDTPNLLKKKEFNAPVEKSILGSLKRGARKVIGGVKKIVTPAPEQVEMFKANPAASVSSRVGDERIKRLMGQGPKPAAPSGGEPKQGEMFGRSAETIHTDTSNLPNPVPGKKPRPFLDRAKNTALIGGAGLGVGYVANEKLREKGMTHYDDPYLTGIKKAGKVAAYLGGGIVAGDVANRLQDRRRKREEQTSNKELKE